VVRFVAHRGRRAGSDQASIRGVVDRRVGTFGCSESFAKYDIAKIRNRQLRCLLHLTSDSLVGWKLALSLCLLCFGQADRAEIHYMSQAVFARNSIYDVSPVQGQRDIDSKATEGKGEGKGRQ
jgi:hypothetical protein